MKTTGISPKWSNLARAWLGNTSGRHCHWCRWARSQDGEATCHNKKSRFCDGERIRTWDGVGCARKCKYFELKGWYKSDKNFERLLAAARKDRRARNERGA